MGAPTLPPGGFGHPIVRQKHRAAERSWADEGVDGFLRRGEPVVLKHGCPLCSKLRWSLCHLGELFGKAELPVHVTPREMRSVTRVYGQGLGVGSISSMSIDDFAQQLESGCSGVRGTASAGSTRTAPPQAAGEERGKPNLYLQVLLAWARGGAVERRAEVQAELDRVDWPWLQRAFGVAGEGGLEACQLWCSNGGVNTPLHYDGSSNFLAQLRGRKRVLLFHPRHSFRLYPYPVGHPLDNYSMVPNPEAADLSRFPAVACAQGVEAVLEPGDVLWLPAYWWHYVCQPDEGVENISLNFWAGRARPLNQFEWLSCRGVSSVPRAAQFWGAAGPAQHEFLAALAALQVEDAPPASLGCAHGKEEDLISALAGARSSARCLHAARMVEHAAALMCGSSTRGGRFLEALAADADAHWPGGNAARRFANRIREAIAEVIGGSDRDVAALLAAITRDGRLYPGLAPPIAGPVVSAERGDVDVSSPGLNGDAEAGAARCQYSAYENKSQAE